MIKHQQAAASTHQLQIHTWTVEEYHQLVKARLVGANQPSELIAGQIICQEPPLHTVGHSSSLKLIRAVLQKRLGDRAWLRSQQPVILNNYSEPKPDILAVTGDASKYRYHNPTPAEIAFILEINEGALTVDCGFKAIEYAQAGIQDYWVLDLQRWQIHVFRDIVDGRYQRRWVLNQAQTMRPLAFPDLVIGLRDPRSMYYVTRKLTGRQAHRRPSLPLLVTLSPELAQSPASVPAEIFSPEAAVVSTSEVKNSQRPLPEWETAAAATETLMPIPVGVGMNWPNNGSALSDCG